MSGVVLLAVAPLAGPLRADAAAVEVVAAEPSEIPGCEADPAGPCEEPTPIVTVTVTDNPEETIPPATPAPQKTVTTTITVPATTPPATTPPATTAPPATTTAPVQPPTAVPVVPSADETTASDEAEVVFPTSDPTAGTPSASPTPTNTSAFEETMPTSALSEIRNAGSDFDGATLSRQLGIPALILVLLVLFAVLIFEGRLRRLAHAAAIRRAGPRALAHHRGDSMESIGYPGYGPAPGFPHGPYQGGTAYAPIISFVPMQMYAPVYPEGYSPEQYAQQTAYMPAPGYEQQSPPTGYGPPAGYEQAPQHGPAGHEASPPVSHDQDAAPFGPEPYEDRFPQGPAEFPGAPFPQKPMRHGVGEEPFTGLQSPPELTSTAVYPLPGQDTDKKTGQDTDKKTGQDTDKKKRGLFRRSK